MTVRIGLFVGGKSARMGGAPKGLLVGPTGETLFARAMRVAASVGQVVVVGDARAYGVGSIADDPPGIGPLGGLAALLRDGPAIALACDMPYVESEHLRALIEHPSRAPIVAAHRDGRWEPFFARYDASVIAAIDAMLAKGAHALQPLFARADAIELDPRVLDDWDTPDDVRARG